MFVCIDDRSQKRNRDLAVHTAFLLLLLLLLLSIKSHWKVLLLCFSSQGIWSYQGKETRRVSHRSQNLCWCTYRGFSQRPCWRAETMKQFCMKIDLISQRRENVLFLPCNMATMTSHENALFWSLSGIFFLREPHLDFFIIRNKLK